MGFIFNGKHSDELGVCFQTKSMPYIAPKRQTIITVQGRDGQYVFEDGYDNIQIELACAIGGDSILERRKRARQISAWLAATGTLIFDYEKDVEYKVVKVTNGINASIIGREYRDEFPVIFECEPHQQQTFYNDSQTWEGTPTAWNYANGPWVGYDRTFLVSPSDIINVVNAGTYKALPIIILTGTAASLTLGTFTFTNLAGTVYIDCKNEVVYSLSGDNKVNRMSTFEGDFLSLKPGTTSFLITGNFTTLIIEFDYKNTYL